MGVHPAPPIALRWVSDRGLLVSLGHEASAPVRERVLASLQQLRNAAIAGLLNLHPAYASVLVVVEPLASSPADVEAAVLAALQGPKVGEPADDTFSGSAAGPSASVRGASAAPPVEIPVCYEPPHALDLDDVARHHGRSADEVVRLHTSTEFTVAFLGFSPGFAYLQGLPPRLHTPRLPTPRTRVPQGSVAIAGEQAGVYPLATPGGWRVLGCTPLRMFDARRERPALLTAGDRVRFVPISSARFAQLARDAAKEPPVAARAPSPRALGGALRVHKPGMLTTVQDAGRVGYGPLGISAAGAADPLSLAVGNRLVGNPLDAPALEMTLVGGTFEFEAPAVVALAGSDFGARIESVRGGSRAGSAHPVPPWVATRIQAGDRLCMGPTRSGARSLLCVRGGIEVPAVLGSVSTHLAGALGGLDGSGRPVRSGDRLPVGLDPGTPLRRLRVPAAELERLLQRRSLRATIGPQHEWFGAAARAQFESTWYEVAEQSDRMGLRLRGAPLAGEAAHSMLTEGVALGAVQVPPTGEPIVLLVEQQTTGGYPKIANVIAADLPAVGQLRPRDRVRFALVSLAQAREALLRQTRFLEQALEEEPS